MQIWVKALRQSFIAKFSVSGRGIALPARRPLRAHGCTSGHSCRATTDYTRGHAKKHTCHAFQPSNLATAEDARLQFLQSHPSLLLHNSLTRRKEAFKPKAPDGTVLMYVCGVTVYDYSHIGHARVYISFDILYRFLQYLGFKVNYTRNFTDIDDKIIKRSQETGTSSEALSNQFIREFHTDMESLHCLPPTLEPKATDNIEGKEDPQFSIHEKSAAAKQTNMQAIISDIDQIIQNGHGYASGGDVFFDVASMPAYGELSGRKKDDNRAGERVAVDQKKRSAADFVLWKAGKEGEPHWDSPWGSGRPGWHIECSAMIRRHMGPAIDIHGGGRDLIFPHHENEIAQAQAACRDCDCQHLHADRGFVNFWLHNGFVNVDSEKMSKSLGNFFTIRDVIQQYHPLALRLFLVGAQYRSPVNYTQAALESAADRVYYLYQALCDCDQALAGQFFSEQDIGRTAEGMIQEMQSGLSDDLNTQNAIASLWEVAKKVNELCHSKKGKKNANRLGELRSCWIGFEAVLGVLGLWVEHPQEVLQEMRQLALRRCCMTEGDVADAIQRRATARAAKDFAKADAVREEVAGRGIQIMDTPGGTIWRPRPLPET